MSCYRNNILQIPAISKEDRGTYFCTAENGIGRAAQHNVTVVVKFAPVITVPKTRLGQALEFDVDLKCQIEAYPLPAIDWLKNGVKITNNQHYMYELILEYMKIVNCIVNFSYFCLEFHILLLQMKLQIP